MKNNYSIKELKVIAEKLRIDMIESMYEAGSGHPGGSLSISEILTVLFFKEMNISPKNKEDLNRDRFVLSKGHAAPALYAALAQKGFFEVSELKKLRKIESFLQGHPDSKKVPGVEISTGSLGQGISVACGMALAAKKFNYNSRIYCIIGDGESQEGQVWEAVMSAAHFKLDNLTLFLDNNNCQIDGNVNEVMSIYPIVDKFKAFNWNVIEINGNDIEKIINGINEAKKCVDKPTVIIAKTIKGCGVSFMENKVEWHGAPIDDEKYEIAIKDLNERYESVMKGGEL